MVDHTPRGPQKQHRTPEDLNASYDRTLQLVARDAKLRQAIEVMQKQHWQMMLVVTVGAGGTLRLSKADYEAAQGYTLFTGVDPVNGDWIFQATKGE